MFGLGIDKKTLLIIFAIIAGITIITSGSESIENLLFSLPGVLIALTFHEYAHAYAAYKLGDDTPKYQGRLNLNPLTHIDPLGFLFLLVAGFGWGKPVQIVPKNFNSKYSLSKAEAIVAVAGPLMNFIIAIVLYIIYYLIFFATNWYLSLSVDAIYIIGKVLGYAISINIALGVFNLIPLPPLDGSKVLMNFLSYRARQWFMEKEIYFYIAFLVLWLTNGFDLIMVPLCNAVIDGISWLVESIFSIF